MHLARAPVDLVGPYEAHNYLNSNIQAFTRFPLLSVATVRPLSCECLTFNAYPLFCAIHTTGAIIRFQSLSVCTSTTVQVLTVVITIVNSAFFASSLRLLLPPTALHLGAAISFKHSRFIQDMRPFRLAPCVTLWYRQLTIVLRPHGSHSHILSDIDCSHLLSVLRFGTSWHRSRITFVSSIAARHGIALCRVLDTFPFDSSTVSSAL